MAPKHPNRPSGVFIKRTAKKSRNDQLLRKALLNNMASVIDPFKPQNPINVEISQSLTEKRKLKAVCFNHKPSQTQPNRASSITKGRDDDKQYMLSIADSADDGSATYFEYKGLREKRASSYVLLFKESGKCTLEPVDASYTFNMTSAPWESDPSQLAKDYVQLSLSPDHAASPAQSAGSVDEELFGDEPTDDEPDPSNPFDWRNCMNGDSNKRAGSKPSSAMHTPHALTPMKTPRTPNAASGTNSQLNSGNKNASKATAARRDTSNMSQASDKNKSPPSKRKRPSISTPGGREADDDDDGNWTSVRDYGALIVEDDTPSLRPPKRHHLLTTPGGGPVSLRAASAAASGATTPTHRTAQSSRKVPRSHQITEEEVEASEDDAHSDDVDVEALELPPPAVKKTGKQSKRPDRPRRESTWDASDVADFQARLEQAMQEREEEEEEENESVDPAPPAVAPTQESESESEEE